MALKTIELAQECKRQSESCLYTSTSLFLWLRFLRFWKVVFIIVPLILGSLASWKLLTESNLEELKVVTAIFSFIAGLMPTIYSALKLDDHLEQCRSLAGEFKNLQDGFRQAALVSSRKTFAEFEAHVSALMSRLDTARTEAVTPPEWCFRCAQKKIKKGDYTFEIDIPALEAESKEKA